MRTALHISEATSLALHATALLAEQGESAVPCADIADHLGVSEAHLSKVLQRLGKHGLVESTRGPTGGFRLARPAHAITLLAVVEAIEGRLHLQGCLLPGQVCDGRGCIFGGLIPTVNAQVTDYLSNTTLAEVSGGGSRDAA